MIVVAGGVKSGIEKFSKVTLPVLFVLIVAIAIYSICLPGAGEGVRYLVKPQLGELTPRTFAYAMGQSFYSLSLGMGAIITYGSYVSKKENILASSAGTAVSDLLFAILAGFAIMPLPGLSRVPVRDSSSAACLMSLRLWGPTLPW